MNPRSKSISHFLILFALLTSLLGSPLMVTPSYAATATASGDTSRAGVTQFIQGVTVTPSELVRRNSAAVQTIIAPRQASPRRPFNHSLTPLSTFSGIQNNNSSPQINNLTSLPQTLADEILGPKIMDTGGFVPPDTMGVVGPTDFLFTTNGRYRAFLKDSPHTQVFNTTDVAFWGSTANAAGVSDSHARYDRTTGRWFITEIDVPNGDNHILLAVSSGPDLSTATWTQYALPATGTGSSHDQGCFADYDTPGIDQNAIYIGANMFGGNSPCSAGSYYHSNLYVVEKSSVLSGTSTLTTFYNVTTGVYGIPTIQGVDSYDALSTGFAIAVKETSSPVSALNLWQINSPGTASPTLSGPIAIPISAENGAIGGVLSANNVSSSDPTRAMDDIDNRLFAAVIRNGHLWTAHNVAVNSSGDSIGNGSGLDRDAVRWYDVTLSTQTLNQSGTIYDNAASNPQNYWMGTVMPSGQGHVVIGLNRANSTTVVQAGVVGRLSGDALGTMSGFSSFQSSTTDAYDDSSFNPSSTNRWGDYSYTSLDPCDDMTLWTTQEYVAGSTFGVDWGIAAEKLLAPPPATPASASPATLGQPSVNVTVTGTSASGSGFYDTPSSLSSESCRKRISATVSGGITVNSVTYTDPTHVTLNISTVGAALGLQTVTITNPDGQLAHGAVLQIYAAERTKNGGFNTYVGASKIPQYWTASNFKTADGKDTTVHQEGTASVKITGTSGITKTLTQTLVLSGLAGDKFLFSFQASGSSIPAGGVCAGQVKLYSGTKLISTQTVNCATGNYGFQLKSLNFTAPKAYTKVVIVFTYSKASGTVWFDAVSLWSKS